MNHIDLDNLFTYHPPVGDQPQRYTRLRAAARAHAEAVVALTPPCADQTAAIRLIREASFTANAAIACSPWESLPPMSAVADSDEVIARVCHEANRGLCAAFGDHSQPPWSDAPEWQRKSAVTGVRFIRDNPDVGPDASHDSWLEEKRRDGWTYGPVKDAVAKTHPCFVPYEELPAEQKAKDYVFGAIVRAAIACESLPPMTASGGGR